MTDCYDALVIGGGPAGATAALLLARAGWSVGLLERKTFPRRKVCGEYLSATNLPLLERLGVAAVFREQAGPPIARVGLFARSAILSADLPHLTDPREERGRALCRERLDTLLLEEAARAGVDVHQPVSAVGLARQGEMYLCEVKPHSSPNSTLLQASIIVTAHGSWDAGSLPTQPPRRAPRPSDLLAFKAHFRQSALPPDLMPLLAFPGGYGGMVHCDGGRVTLSCCIRRDMLSRIRSSTASDAGETVLGHILESCAGVRRALSGAERDGPWLSAGPIRPGIRLHAAGGIFPVGNAAGEAHPVVAEGISMAMQSAWLLATRLIAWRKSAGRVSHLAVMGDYAAAWRRTFASRLFASQMLAGWAMRPTVVGTALPLVRCFPPILSWGARWSGKTHKLSL